MPITARADVQVAPVLPADTNASARPSATRLAHTRTEEFLFRRPWHPGRCESGRYYSEDILHRDDFASFVVTALRTDTMRLLRFMALRTDGRRLLLEEVMCAPGACSRFAVASFWVRHFFSWLI